VTEPVLRTYESLRKRFSMDCAAFYACGKWGLNPSYAGKIIELAAKRRRER
jgi:hypothetical protein